MCPVCIATAAAVIAAKTSSAGGATALFVKKFRKKDGPNGDIRRRMKINERTDGNGDTYDRDSRRVARGAN